MQSISYLLAHQKQTPAQSFIVQITPGPKVLCQKRLKMPDPRHFFIMVHSQCKSKLVSAHTRSHMAGQCVLWCVTLQPHSPWYYCFIFQGRWLPRGSTMLLLCLVCPLPSFQTLIHSCLPLSVVLLLTGPCMSALRTLSLSCSLQYCLTLTIVHLT